jgi:hypothetical protein
MKKCRGCSKMNPGNDRNLGTEHGRQNRRSLENHLRYRTSKQLHPSSMNKQFHGYHPVPIGRWFNNSMTIAKETILCQGHGTVRSRLIPNTATGHKAPIEIANLACQNLLGRKYNHESDYVQWVKKFESAQEHRKCQVSVDYSEGEREVGKGIPLVCY